MIGNKCSVSNMENRATLFYMVTRRACEINLGQPFDF